MTSYELVSDLKTISPNDPIYTNYPLSQECSFKIGGPAKFFYVPHSITALRTALAIAKKIALPCFVLGQGSNVVFSDKGFAGIVISTKNLKTLTLLPDHVVQLQPGVTNQQLSEFTIKEQLTGFEWAAGLPGTIGGSIFMNAKCYGNCFSDIVEQITVITPEDEIIKLQNDACNFNYKYSILQSNNYILVSALLNLKPGNKSTISKKNHEILADRKEKGQFLFPSAGCIFKNNYTLNIPTGQLIADCGLKGYTLGDLQIFDKHANFIVNLGQGTCKDLLALIKVIKDKVREKFNIELEEEVRIFD